MYNLLSFLQQIDIQQRNAGVDPIVSQCLPEPVEVRAFVGQHPFACGKTGSAKVASLSSLICSADNNILRGCST